MPGSDLPHIYSKELVGKVKPLTTQPPLHTMYTTPTLVNVVTIKDFNSMEQLDVPTVGSIL